MKRYRKQINRHFFNYMILFMALLYSGWLCFSGFRNSTHRQVQDHFTTQVHYATFLALDGQNAQNFVSLRRDTNHDIIAVTVNGILLSQLQIQFQNALEAIPPQCNLELRVADVFGNGLFSWIPGGIQTSCHIKMKWDASIISRTIERNENTIHFQLILITKGTGNYFSLFSTNIEEEFMLYETMIYTTGT